MAASIVLERLLLPPGATAAEFTRRRVYIFMTRQGLLFGLTIAVMLLGAVNYTNSMAYILTFLLASLYMVCMLHSYRNLRGLVLRLGDAEPVFAGEAARFPLLFDNRAGSARVALGLRVHPSRARRRRGAAVTGPAFDLGAGELRREYFELTAPRRGRYRLEQLLLESTWPLGIFRAWSYLDTAPEVLVYPRPAGTLPLPESEAAEAQDLAGRRPGTDDFAGFRAWRAGDSIRSIDWKALARERGLLVKRFTGAGSRRIRLRWDLAGTRAGDEQRLAQLCRWVLDADRGGMSYALELPGTVLEYDRGPAHRRRCLDLLAAHGGGDAYLP